MIRFLFIVQFYSHHKYLIFHFNVKPQIIPSMTADALVVLEEEEQALLEVNQIHPKVQNQEENAENKKQIGDVCG